MKTLKTKKDIENDPRVESIHRAFGFACEDKWGWWCYLKPQYICSNKSSTINERRISDICHELNNCVKLKHYELQN